jgi:aspartate oxidase
MQPMQRMQPMTPALHSICGQIAVDENHRLNIEWQ